MIVASLCTIPARHVSFRQVLFRILGEQTQRIDKLHIWLNGYTECPADLPADARIEIHLEPTNPGPWVRYQSARELVDDDIFLTLDDDLIYPADYVERGVAVLSSQPDNTSICFGGVFWDAVVPIDELEYHLHKRLISCPGYLGKNRFVPVLMGGASFHYGINLQNVIGMELPGFATNDDLMVSYHLQQNDVKIVSVAKPQDWIAEHPLQNAGHALWRTDRTVRVGTFSAMVRVLGFQPWSYQTRANERQLSVLLISTAELPLGYFQRIKELLPEISLHTLEIVAGNLSLLTSRPLRDCFEHFVSVPDSSGRFEFVPGVRQWRHARMESQGWAKSSQYLKWLEAALDIHKIGVVQMQGETVWLERKLNKWIAGFPSEMIIKFPRGV